MCPNVAVNTHTLGQGSNAGVGVGSDSVQYVGSVGGCVRLDVPVVRVGGKGSPAGVEEQAAVDLVAHRSGGLQGLQNRIFIDEHSINKLKTRTFLR